MTDSTLDSKIRIHTAIVRPQKVDDIRDALARLGHNSMTVTEVRGSGREKGHTAIYMGKEYSVSLLPKMKLYVAVPREISDSVEEAIIKAARTGEIGDGRTWWDEPLNYTNIRTGEGFHFDMPDSEGKFYGITAIVRPNKVDGVREALGKIGLTGMIVTEVRGNGRQKGHTAYYRGKEYSVSLLPKMEIDIVVPANKVEDAYKAILKEGRTGYIGDGRIWLIDEVIDFTNIRTGEVYSVSTPNNTSNSNDILCKAVVRPNKVDDVKEALEKIGYQGMTVTEVRGHGHQKGHTAIYKGKEYPVSLLPKMLIERVIAGNIFNDTLQAIVDAARIGEIGDGRVFGVRVGGYKSIRTGLGPAA